MINTGVFISASSQLSDTFFAACTIFITRNDENGTIGYVLNKPFGRNLNELAEFAHTMPVALFDGGPVNRELLYIIHRRPDIIKGGELVRDGIYVGGDMQDVVGCFASGTLTQDEIRIFIGNCGWDEHELEAEVEEGSWTVSPTGNIFSTNTA